MTSHPFHLFGHLGPASDDVQATDHTDGVETPAPGDDDD